MNRIGSVLVFGLGLTASARSADHVVVPGQSIQAAIATAAPGDRVLVQPGVYGQTIDLLGKDIDVIGVGGPAVTILDAAGSPWVLVSMLSGEPATASVSGFTLRGGLTGVRIAGPTSAVVRQVIVEGMTKFGLTVPYAGDGVFAVPTQQPFPQLIETIVRGNAGTGVVGQWDIARCVVSGNGATGVVGANSCTETFVVGNVGTFGGGLANGKSYSRCVIASNTATFGGGGDFSNALAVTLAGCEFRGNTATQRGGGIRVTAENQNDDSIVPQVTIDGCSFFNNTAAQAGGAIDLVVDKLFPGPKGSTDLRRSTFVGNQPNGVAGRCDLTRLQDSVFWAQVNPIVVKRASNPSIDTALFAEFTLSTTLLFGTGNLSTDPRFVDQALGDLHLKESSPCIGAGSIAQTVDVEGGAVAGVLDIGADEFAAHLSVPEAVVSGGPITFRAYGPSGAEVLLFASLKRLDTALPTAAGPFSLGFPLLPAFPLNVGQIGANSRLELSTIVPTSVPVGTVLHFQAYVGGQSQSLTLPVTVLIG